MVKGIAVQSNLRVVIYPSYNPGQNILRHFKKLGSFHFAGFIAHEKTFMAFSNDFQGILTIPGFTLITQSRDLFLKESLKVLLLPTISVVPCSRPKQC